MQRSGGGALFGSVAAGPGSTGGNKHLVELRAGKMYMKGRMVYPDKRKGLLYVYQSDETLMHFCWQDRTSGVVEDDLIIFPDDCEYIKVPQCTTGRVYLLKFKSSNRRFFFWLQEPIADKDEENCKRINEFLNNPRGSVPSVSTTVDQDLQSLLNNMSQSQLVQLFGGGAGQMGGLHSLLGTISRPYTGSARTTTPAITHRSVPVTTPTQSQPSSTSTSSTPPTSAAPTTAPDAPKAKPASRASQRAAAETPSTAAGNPIQLADLQTFLQGISPVPSDQQSVDLSTALNSDVLSGLLNSSDALEQLQGHLPAVDEMAQEALRSTLQSPQFQQAVSQFSSALESGQLGPVVSQLAVNPEAVAAATQGNMQEFVKALEKNSGESSSSDGKKKEESETKSKDKKGDKDDDEDMQID